MKTFTNTVLLMLSAKLQAKWRVTIANNSSLQRVFVRIYS